MGLSYLISTNNLFYFYFLTISGGFNRNGLYRLLCLNAWPIGGGTIGRCGLVGVSMALLEEVCHCARALRSHVFKLPSATMDQLLPTHHHAAPHHDDNGLNL